MPCLSRPTGVHLANLSRQRRKMLPKRLREPLFSVLGSHRYRDADVCVAVSDHLILHPDLRAHQHDFIKH